MPKVTFVTSADLPELSSGFHGLKENLESRGIEVDIAVWDDPSVDWQKAGVCVILTVPDFADRPDEFFAWAESVPQVLNDPAILRWSSDKHSLIDLANRGMPMIETMWLEPSANYSKQQIHTRMPAGGDFVVKSSVTSNRHLTGRYTAVDARSRSAAIAHAESIMERGNAAMVQRFAQSNTTDRNEVSLVYFNGLLSHSVEKEAILQTKEVTTARFKRSRAFPHEATDAERHLGEDVRKALHAQIRELTGRDHLLIYSRIDLTERNGKLEVLDVSLMDVSLYLHQAEGAMDRFAEAIEMRTHL